MLNKKLFWVLIFLLFVVSIGFVSAGDNGTEVLNEVSPEDSLADALSDELSVENEVKNLDVDENSNVVSGEKVLSSTETAKSQTIKTKVKTYDIDSNIYKKSKIFKIKITNKKTNKPIKNLKIALKIENNFKKYKTYILKTNNKGIAKFNIKNLKMGFNSFDISSKDPKYSVEGFSGVSVGKLKGPVTVKMNSQIKLKNGDTLSTFSVKKFDGMYSKGIYASGDVDNKRVESIYKVKFYFKNSNGKVITKTLYSQKTKFIKGYTPFKVKIWYLEAPMRTTVKEKNTVFKYKSNSYYKLKITGYTKAIKNIKIKFKIKNNNKYKTYTLKTNNKGVIKFNTHNLKLGYHNVKISSIDKNYDVNFKSKIFIGKSKKSDSLKNDESLEFKNGDFIYASFGKTTGSKNSKLIRVSSSAMNDYGSNIAPKSHVLIKAKVFFKNDKNNKIVIKTLKNEYNIKIKPINGYTPVKVQVWYLQA